MVLAGEARREAHRKRGARLRFAEPCGHPSAISQVRSTAHLTAGGAAYVRKREQEHPAIVRSRCWCRGSAEARADGQAQVLGGRRASLHVGLICLVHPARRLGWRLCGRSEPEDRRQTEARREDEQVGANEPRQARKPRDVRRLCLLCGREEQRGARVRAGLGDAGRVVLFRGLFFRNVLLRQNTTPEN